MNLFKRSKSIISRSSDRQTDPIPPSSASSSSSKHLVAPTNLPHPQHLIPPKEDGRLLSNDRAPADSFAKGLLAKRVGHRNAEDPKSHQYASSGSSSLAPPPRTSPRSAKTIYTNHTDMYTQNDLNTFSFGAAHSTLPSSYQHVDPFSRPRDEADSDDVIRMPDTTPRPSVVGSAAHRTHPSHSNSPSRQNHHQDRGVKAQARLREPDSDTASTFGTSSASASASSLAQPRQNYSSTSQTSGRSSEAPQTSANDSTSDEETDGRHPFPPTALQPRLRGLRNRDQESSLYLSEEDFENYNEDFDHDINGSEGNTRRATHSANLKGSQEDHLVEPTERRGSVARDIPSPQSGRSYMDGHPRDHYARRPSRSLEELSSFSFATASGPSYTSRNIEDRQIPIAPTSVPESEGDWRDLRKKSIQRDKDLPPIFNSNTNMSSSTASVADSHTNSSTAIGSHSSSNDITFGWMQDYAVNGVVTFDPSEMEDIIGEGQNGQGMSLNAFRKGSSSTFRRQSTVSSVDIFSKRIVGWGGKTFKSQIPMWTFTKDKDRPDVDSSSRHNGDRERPSITSIFSSRPSTSTSVEVSASGSRTFFDKSDSKDKDKFGKEKLSGKEKQTKEPWRGMALDSEEVWVNGAIGRFKIYRRNASSNEPGKPPQQRLTITFLRSQYYNSEQPLEGPTVTIHKHSKAGAFSISRHFRVKPSLGPQDTSASLRNHTSSSQLASRDIDMSEGGRKKSNTMILLAPRRVQRAYTSTNTTRKLESHGLLDESGRTSPRDIERMRREHGREERMRAKEGEKEKKKDKKGKEKEKDRSARKLVESSSKRSLGSKVESISKAPAPPEAPLPDSSEGSSAGSVGNALSSGNSDMLATNNTSTISTPESSQASTSVPGTIEPAPSHLSHETASSDLTVQRTVRSHHRKRGVYDIDDDDDEEDSDERPRYPTRTPHRETYAALPPEVFENVHQESSHGIFGWGKSRNADRNGHRVNPYLEASYNPPWPTTNPRSHPETNKYIVDDLNTSFQDVGLLPATGEIKSSSSSQHKRKHNRDQPQAKQTKRPTEQQTDIFEEVPADALYMLLPMWPGETDPASTRNYPYKAPPIPIDKRQYLMIYYKAFLEANPPPESNSKTKSSEKKRSRESSNPGDNDRNVLLSRFHISARIVLYRELQGTGVRIPDLGLAVSGRMEDAWASIPPSACPKNDYVIGVCHSRASGVDFFSEGFEKLGLATHVPRVPDPTEDDDSQSADSLAILTPIGRAVMEMAWLGAMALTSFNPNL